MFDKKKSARFVVPSLAEADADYAALLQRRDELHARQAELRSRRSELEATIAKMPEPMVRASVAAILGDAPDSKSGLRQELTAVLAEARDIDTAQEVLRQRLDAARSKASVAICAKVEPEYRARTAAIAEALKRVAAAREHFHELVDGLETEDVSWTRLGPLSLGFLGDRHDGHIPRFLKETGHA